jgi:hypothetical protein
MYIRLLRTSRPVRLHALEAAHIQMRSGLHALAANPEPDTGAFIHAMQRLPNRVADVSSVFIGQQGEQFRAVLGPDNEQWKRVEAVARRRVWRRDGYDTPTVHASSASDPDDFVPCLVAYQIEWNKLHVALRRAGNLVETEQGDLAVSGERLGWRVADWARLARIHRDGFAHWLHNVTRAPKDIHIQLLGNNDIVHTRLARRWW